MVAPGRLRNESSRLSRGSRPSRLPLFSLPRREELPHCFCRSSAVRGGEVLLLFFVFEITEIRDVVNRSRDTLCSQDQARDSSCLAEDYSSSACGLDLAQFSRSAVAAAHPVRRIETACAETHGRTKNRFLEISITLKRCCKRHDPQSGRGHCSRSVDCGCAYHPLGLRKFILDRSLCPLRRDANAWSGRCSVSGRADAACLRHSSCET